MIDLVNRPTIVCLCGSTRFLEAFDRANIEASLQGHIVLSVASTRQTDQEIFAKYSPPEVRTALERLAELHRAKIALADEILVLNVGGYIGSSTAAEIAYAIQIGKTVRYLEQAHPNLT